MQHAEKIRNRLRRLRKDELVDLLLETAGSDLSRLDTLSKEKTAARKVAMTKLPACRANAMPLTKVHDGADAHAPSDVSTNGVVAASPKARPPRRAASVSPFFAESFGSGQRPTVHEGAQAMTDVANVEAMSADELKQYIRLRQLDPSRKTSKWGSREKLLDFVREHEARRQRRGAVFLSG